MSVSSEVLLNEPNGNGFAHVFGDANAVWTDANQGSFGFDVGWDIDCDSSGSCDRAGVSIGDGWFYTFTADATGAFTLDYSWFANSAGGTPGVGVFGMADLLFSFTGFASEGFGDSTNTSASASDSGTFMRGVIAGQTYTASVTLQSDIGTNVSADATMLAEFNWLAPTSVPEPVSLALVVLGLAGMGFARGIGSRVAR